MKIIYKFSFLLILCLFINLGETKAKDIGEFMQNFSLFCFQNLANVNNSKAILNYKGWKPVDEETMRLLGKPANPEAIVEGYKIIIEDELKKGYVIAFTHVPSTGERLCTLLALGDEDYALNIDLLTKYFDVNKLSSNKEGLAFSEFWKVRHSMFKQSYIMTQKYSDLPKGKDLAMFHIHGYD